MQKNIASQKWVVFAFDRTTNIPTTGDAANITANIQIDFATAAGTNDVNPTELEDGYYSFDLTQAETNGDQLVIYPVSATADIQVVGVPGTSFTIAANFPDGTIATVTTLTNKTGFSLAATGLDAIASTATGMVEIAKATWDRVLNGANHNIPASAGRRLRGIQEFQGYEGGHIFIDTVNGTAGTIDYENGTVERPCLTLAAAITIATSLSYTRFFIINGSTIPLTSTFNNNVFDGDGWALSLGGQDVGGTHFHGATVSGVGTGTSTIEFVDCAINTCTLNPFHIVNCGFSGTVTFGAAGDYVAANCHSSVAGAATPIFDTGAAIANINLSMPNYDQGIEIQNLNTAGTDLFSISGHGQIIYAASSSGTVNQRGSWRVTNTGGVTIVADDNTTNLMSVLDDTGTTGVLLAATATSPQLVDDILDEPNTGGDHNVLNSLGRQIRELRQTNLYLGAIHVDTINGTPGAVDYDNGTFEAPVNNIADALTLAISLGYQTFEIAPASSITLASTFANYAFIGNNWSVSLGGQICTNSMFIGGHLSGSATGTAGSIHLRDCELATSSFDSVHANNCSLSGTITLSEAGDYVFADCHSAVAGPTTPIIDTGAAVANVNLTMPNYKNGIEIANLNSTGVDNFSIAGQGQIIYSASSSGAVNQRGDWKVTNTGGVTITPDDNTTNISSALTRLPTALISGRMDSDVEAINNNTTAAVNLRASALGIVSTSVNDAGATTTVFITALTEATDDHFNGRVIIFTSGALANQGTDITDYNGATKAVTVTALTESPANGTTFVIV